MQDNNVDFGCNENKICPFSQVDHLKDHNSEKVYAESQQIVALLPSPTLKALVEIIRPLFVYACCNCFVLYFSVFYFNVVLKSLHTIKRILLISVWKPFGHILNRKCFPELVN